MNESRKVKLGTRLTQIETMVSNDYDHIWDCCCDHGLLGFQLLENKKADVIHFVDIVPTLLNEIEQKLIQFYRGKADWQLHCTDVAHLPVHNYPDKKHLIIIAGVGGQLLIALLKKLHSITTALNVEFLLSPVHHNYALREFLIGHDYGLINELITEENSRFYEIIHVSQNAEQMISVTGEAMWKVNTPAHLTYLKQTISHYQRIARNPNIEISHIIKAYQDLLPSV